MASILSRPQWVKLLRDIQSMGNDWTMVTTWSGVLQWMLNQTNEVWNDGNRHGSKQYEVNTLQWCHNGHDGVSNHQPHHCLHNRLFGCRSKKTSMLQVTGLCAGNSPETGEFPAQLASNAENVSIWWRHHEFTVPFCLVTWFCYQLIEKQMTRQLRL